MNREARHYRNLVSSNESVFLIVDCQREFYLSNPEAKQPGVVTTIIDLLSAARHLSVPVIVTTLKVGEVNGALFDGLEELVTSSEVFRRDQINPWDHASFRDAIHTIGRPRLVVGGHCCEGSLSFSVLSALEEGYEVYIVQDASDGSSPEHHATAIQRMVQAGAVPVTARQILLEWNRHIAEPSLQRRPT